MQGQKAWAVTYFAIGDGYAVYRGPSPGGHAHRHAAFQIAIAAEAVMVDGDGETHRGAALLVAPMTAHRLLPVDDLLTYYIEPQSTFADRLRARCPHGVAAVPELAALTEQDVAAASTRPSSELDARLREALELLRDGRTAIPAAAAVVGLSPQWLRALAKAQVGMPLPRWRVWARLRLAASAMGAGSTPAEAAAAAGFADQAHLTRQMREMLGLTPTAVIAARPNP